MSRTPQPPPLDLAALRRRGAGRDYWSSLEDLAAVPPAPAWERDDPAGHSGAGVSRRHFMQIMAASLAASGLAACDRQPEQIVQAVTAPTAYAPGETTRYATTLTFDGYAIGVLAAHWMGRPIRLEGNPDHPASLGALDIFTQAAILDLYDPNRARAATVDGRIASRQAVAGAVLARAAALAEKRGEGLRLLTQAITSPTLIAEIGRLAAAFPGMRWHQWDMASRANLAAGAALAFGRPLDSVPHLDRAEVILAIDSDLLSTAPGHLHHARNFARGRRADANGGRMNRLYAVESTPTLAGANADHRFVLRPDEIALALRALAAAVGAAPAAGTAPDFAPWLPALAQDLLRHRGAGLVHVGPEAPPALHATAHAINRAIGAPGRTLTLIEPVATASPEGAESLAELVADMAAGRVDTLLIVGGDPVYSAPPDLGFAEALGRVDLSIYLGPRADATAARCRWHVPQTHGLESWGDARAFDGTASIRQPQILPLSAGRTALELLAMLRGDPDPDARALVRAHWQAEAARRGPFEDFWTEALRRGVIADTAAPEVDAALRPDLFERLGDPAPARPGALQALFRPDPGLWDGRFAGNGWLQELPRPLTRLTWDNAALVAPATAERLGLTGEQVVELSAGGRSLRAPVYILPGQAEDCITLPLGYGRALADEPPTGFDANRLRSADALWRRDDIALLATGDRYRLATTQHQDRMQGRDIVRSLTLAEFRANPAPSDAPDASLYPDYRYAGNAWGMAVNLSSCIGCGACAIACQMENNIPVVGKEEVLRGRAMHWLRIDRYYRGGIDAPDTAFQPVLCMHCEKAPCEVACPVGATVHDSEGLNAMVYNRCIGTRFCSNNCPYKVRRFNFFDYAGREDRPAEARNPDVSVRRLGVMEKCTYCVQRIRAAHIEADREGRPIRDGEIVTACQAACPAEVFTFGDVNDPGSAVSARKASPLDYALLGELNTRPRTSYAARLTNPNPDIGEG